jgi:hypothetical protein
VRCYISQISNWSLLFIFEKEKLLIRKENEFEENFKIHNAHVLQLEHEKIRDMKRIGELEKSLKIRQKLYDHQKELIETLVEKKQNDLENKNSKDSEMFAKENENLENLRKQTKTDRKIMDQERKKLSLEKGNKKRFRKILC